MIDKNNFWDINYYNNPELTPEMIALAEQKLHITLPQAYIALLKIMNGGFTKGFVFPIEFATAYAGNKIPLPDLFGIVINEQHNSCHNILCTEYMAKEWGLPPKQVLLSGDGHSWLTLDYRMGNEPCVSWIDVESNEDVLIADSFEQFLYGLIPDEICIEE